MPRVLDEPLRTIAPPEGFPILESKLTRPRWREGLVARPRLVQRFTGLARFPLIGAVAPAGYGKSTALAEWAGADDRAVAWLTLDERDSDPAVLLGYLALALQQVLDLPARAFEGIHGSGESAWTSALATLSHLVAASSSPFVLVIDDVEIASQDSIDAIVTLAEALPAGSQIAIATRTARLLPVPHLMAAGMLSLVEREDFALDDAEAARVLAMAGARLDAAQVHRVNEAAEGWAAGVYLAALSLRSGSPSGDGAPIPVTGRRLVADYLRAEILARLPYDDLHFLIRTSVLDRLGPAVCDAVLESTGSSERLRELERSNLFLVPLDAHGGTYRWHGMLRELLVAELFRTNPEIAPGLYRRAATWYEAAGETETALEYAFAGRDTERIGRLMLELSQQALDGGRVETLRNWYEWYERHLEVPDQVEVSCFGAIVFALIGNAGAAERWADRVETASAAQPGAARGLRAHMRAILCASGIEAMLDEARAAVADLSIGMPVGPDALSILGVAEALNGEADLGDITLARAVDAGQDAGRKMTLALALVHRGWLALRRADWVAAEGFAHDARAVVVDGRLSELAAGVAASALAARIAAHRGGLAQARLDAAHAQRHRDVLTHALPWLAIRARIDLAFALLAMGDAGGARVLLGEIREIAARRSSLGLLEEETAELQLRLDSARGGIHGASTLTMAELRLLPLLATHLSFREIADRLFLSTNTVKTQAKSIYRKLDAASRSEAIDRATSIGLLESSATVERFSQRA